MKKYTDQEFLYRQTPVNYDDIAKFTSIKGNTLGWNQLVQNGNFADASGWSFGTNVTTHSIANNECAMSTTEPQNAEQWVRRNIGSIQQGHKYLLSMDAKGNASARSQIVQLSPFAFIFNESQTITSSYQRIYFLFTSLSNGSNCYLYLNFDKNSELSVKNVNLFDLTQMELDITDPSEFTSLFSLPYYAYNQGTLLSFNGNGIKTVGANQWHNPITGQTINDTTGEVRTSANTDWMADKILIGADKKLYLYLEDVGGYTRGSVNIAMYGTNGYLGKTNALQSNPQVPQKKVITLNQNTKYVIPFGYMSGGATSITDVEMTLANIDINEYVPYTSSTLSLPISTYFPNGMKSAGNVYDELTESKAITRVGSRAYQSGDENNANYVTDGTTTYYPLATETETDAEDIFYKFYGNGTEQILPVNGATPTTAPIIADIEYYNQIESETPYRKFWLVNGNGERWDLTEKELKSFLENPQGLGFQKTIDVTRYGERAYKNTESYNFPQVTGDVLFYDSANSTRYEKYNEFVRFLMEQPITLHYMIPVSYNSLIADTYSLECEVMSLTKTESKTDRILTSNIQMNGLGFYEGDEIEINGTANTLTINNKGDFPVGFEIELRGTYKNPYFTLEQNGELYGEAKFDDNANNFSSVFVNSKDGEQNVVLKQNNSIMPNPLAYQDLSISNGSIYVTFVKLAKGESTLTIGGDSYTISGYTIRYTPIYRSV